jgi:tetratricopeptide (TPR) repeat protein
MELYCVLLSETRGAVIGIIGGLFLAAVAYVALTKNRQLRLWGGVLIAIFVVVVAGGYAFHNDLPQGGMLHRVFNLKDANTEARIIQWGVALRGYKDYPILGVGPEDYYLIANKYYNPAIYQYDPSWFDKPHNYLIEVLVTSGIFGFIAYVSLLGFTLWALWLAYKKGLLNLLELCLLAAGFLSYTFQNLTVFDTISASLTFFVFVGFAGYLWRESLAGDDNGKKKLTRGLQPAFVNTVVLLSVVVVIYGLWALNITGMEAGKAVNYGYAYSSVDPQTAQTYFERAISRPFYFDPVQISSKYSDFAINLAQNPGTQTPVFVNQMLQDAIAAQKDAINRVGNDPTAWQELSSLYLSSAIYNKIEPDPEALTAAQQAVALAPKRPEPTLTEARIDLYENNSTTAESLLETVVNNIPQDNDAKLQLAIVYAYNQQTAKGLQIAQAVLDTGYVPAQTNEISWMGQAYQDEGNYAAAAKIYQDLVMANASDMQDMWNLAQMDAKIGDKQDAIAIAQQLMAEDSKDAAQFQAFIDSLK